LCKKNGGTQLESRQDTFTGLPVFYLLQASLLLRHLATENGNISLLRNISLKHQQSREVPPLSLEDAQYIYQCRYFLHCCPQGNDAIFWLSEQLVDPVDFKTPKTLHEDLGFCDYGQTVAIVKGPP
ncbi:hypothetical protein TNIN_311251, partial [Trichonephila inaurata madagascariensis]